MGQQAPFFFSSPFPLHSSSVYHYPSCLLYLLLFLPSGTVLFPFTQLGGLGSLVNYTIIQQTPDKKNLKIFTKPSNHENGDWSPTPCWLTPPSPTKSATHLISSSSVSTLFRVSHENLTKRTKRDDFGFCACTGPKVAVTYRHIYD